MAELITSKKAAEIIGIHPVTLAKWRMKGKGPKFQKIGHSVLYLKSVVKRWTKKHN